MNQKASHDWPAMAAILAGAAFCLMAVGAAWGVRSHLGHEHEVAPNWAAEAVDQGVTLRFTAVEPADRVVRLVAEDGFSYVVAPGSSIELSSGDFEGSFTAAGYDGPISVRFEADRVFGPDQKLSVSGAMPRLTLDGFSARVTSR